MLSSASVVVALSLASSTFAALAFTSPTATIGFTGGQPANITWMDDGTAPALSAYGPCKASIYAGNAISQTELQTINPSIDPASTTFLTFTPDATIGPNSDEYFIRFESLNNKDPSNPAIPLLAFSHTFALSSMTGVFNAQVQSEIDGQSTAPIGGSAAASTAAATSAAAAASTPAASKSTLATSTVKSAASGSASGSAKAAAATGSSAAVPQAVASPKLWLGIVTGVAGAVMGAALL